MNILNAIRSGEKSGSFYFTVEDCEGNDVKIRVSDHSANRQNNGSQKTLSFVTERTEQRKSGYNRMIEEYVVDADGYIDNSQELIERLEWENIY